MPSARAHPAIADVLGDPLVQLVMRADGVDPQALASELGTVAAKLRPQPTSRAWRPVGGSKRPRLCRQKLCNA